MHSRLNDLPFSLDYLACHTFAVGNKEHLQSVEESYLLNTGEDKSNDVEIRRLIIVYIHFLP